VWCRLRMNRQDKIEGREVVSPIQNWGATRRTESTRSRNLRTATDASRHDFSPQFTAPGGCTAPLHLRSDLNPMGFPVPRSLVCPGRLEDARASASRNHSAVSSFLDVSEVFSPKLRLGGFHPGSLGKRHRRITVTVLWGLGAPLRSQLHADYNDPHLIG
jgi:hypothetical protein